MMAVNKLLLRKCFSNQILSKPIKIKIQIKNKISMGFEIENRKDTILIPRGGTI